MAYVFALYFAWLFALFLQLCSSTDVYAIYRPERLEKLSTMLHTTDLGAAHYIPWQNSATKAMAKACKMIVEKNEVALVIFDTIQLDRHTKEILHGLKLPEHLHILSIFKEKQSLRDTTHDTTKVYQWNHFLDQPLHHEALMFTPAGANDFLHYMALFNRNRMAHPSLRRQTQLAYPIQHIFWDNGIFTFFMHRGVAQYAAN